MSSRLEHYLTQLRAELRRRRLVDERLVEEAREHLVDRIDHGLRCGLAREVAEQKAFDGFGSPATIAECAAAERHHMWQRKWWVLVPTIASAVVASVASSYLLPVRYQSEARLEFISVSDGSIPGRVTDHLNDLNDQLTSPRLERMIEDLNLYENERRTASLGSVVRQMRQDINITVIEKNEASGVQALAVRFAAFDPLLAQRGTARLASLFIDEHAGQAPGVERRATGEQLKIVEPAGLSEQPVGLSPVESGAIGAGGGFLLSLTLIGATTRRRREN